MSALTDLLDGFRAAAVTPREKGTYFEELILAYLKHEPSYADLYEGVWTYGDWAVRHNLKKQDAGIDLVAETFTGEAHAIQCKFYDPGDVISKAEIDSFFTASGKKPFTHRLLVLSVDALTEHAEDALRDQHIPVSTIRLADLEASRIDWSRFKLTKSPVLKARKRPRAHQKLAIADVRTGFVKHERGKLLMACGTGKTFTALQIAEAEAGAGRRVLFLVPSLALLSQSLTEWTQDSEVPLHSFAVCSDSDVGKKGGDSEGLATRVHELRYPATTNAKQLAGQAKQRHDHEHMTVVFATYHSIDVIHKAQKDHALPAFDLVICDEAHRTTGATFAGEDESAFVRVHKDGYLKAKRRLYMTATPRIFAPHAKATAIKENVELASMDDVALYGPVFHRLTFSEAVQQDLLVDYKVIVLAIEETHINKRLQALLASPENDLRVDDAARIVGCWKALAKQGLVSSKSWQDTEPMRRAVAFCQVIERTAKAKRHQVASKSIAATFQSVVEAYQRSEPDSMVRKLRCEAQHVDGGMNAGEKESKLSWLKADAGEDTCRILSNVRCLSEGVDVPALDAVLFLAPRNSQVDVVQSVGRVMRKAPGKQRGYVVLPVVIPAGVDPKAALDDNETYRVVWQVLQALRAHDDRFDAMVNKIDLLQTPDLRHMEVVAITDRIAPKGKAKGIVDEARGRFVIGARDPSPAGEAVAQQLAFEIGVIERAIYAKLVEKVGSRHYWEDWADDIARIARTHIDRLSVLLGDKRNIRERAAFQAFATELRDDLNDSLSDEEIVEMLAQHLITKPVFEAVFSGSEFAARNPISVALQKVLDVLHEQRLEKEAETLQGFYANVKMRAAGIDTAEGRQRIIVELYDKFFRNAFPRLTDRLGIVYTPVEVVDFIIHSVADLLKEEFGQTLGSPGVHIIDPFTGTGTFITRLLQSGLIEPDELARKYREEIHANEIILLAYYIAGVNIEAVYHDVAKAKDYVPFEGIILTDTFQMYEKPDQVDALLEDNSARRKRQRGLDIRVIIGNPPYSAGQKSGNDNNQNVEYPLLDARIESTYAGRSSANLKTKLYDSYVRALRWASDRVGTSGIVGFVTNAGWLDASSFDGLRKCFVEEFSSIYVFHLRGNQRTQGEQSRKEGGKIFGSGSRAPIAISLFVKNPARGTPGQPRLHDIGDYLSREQKLARIAALGSVAGISAEGGWKSVTPDAHGDWISQRESGFARFLPLGDKTGKSQPVFGNYSLGVATNRDAWTFNPSRRAVEANMRGAILFYNAEVERYRRTQSRRRGVVRVDAREFVDKDPRRFGWAPAQYEGVPRGRIASFDATAMRPSLYRPFAKSWLYFDRFFNNRVYQQPQLFPNSTSENRLILCNANFGGAGCLAIMTDVTPDLHSNGDAQCFPLYLYDVEDPGGNEEADPQLELGTAPRSVGGKRRHAITDAGLKHFQSAYPAERISKEDLFYYIYGLLHSREYLARYADNLSKELPRIPRVRSAKDFWSFSKAGRDLAELHVNFEQVQPYPARIVADGKLTPAHYHVTSMRHGKVGREKDRTTIIYNERITVRDIPLEAYDYVINGRSAIDWVIERQAVWTDKASGIVHDANDYAIETAKNPKYPLELLLRVITVSLETLRIVGALPALDLLET